jgi:hypothetical protein
MFKVKLVVFIFIMGLSLQNIHADETINSALQQTQECLRNQNCESAKTDAGKMADHNALDAVGGNALNKQALYNISADIMPTLEKQAGGDPAKLQAIILKAQADPEGFLNSLPPELLAKIKNVANTIK